jgi:hypothetical protein
MHATLKNLPGGGAPRDFSIKQSARVSIGVLRSRVSRGTRCTTLVAAMISSAGSLSKSKALIERQMSSVNGQVSIRANVRGQLGVLQVELDAA